MSHLQKRRRAVCEAIIAHLSTHGSRRWRLVQAEFPDLPAATFWRYVKDIGLEHGDIPPPIRQILKPASDPYGRTRSLPKASRREIKNELASTRRDIAQSRARQAQTERMSGATLGQAMMSYDIQVLSKLRTAAKQRRSLAYIIEPLADIPCFAFSEDDLAPIINATIARGAVTHANRMLGYFNAFARWAFEEGYLLQRPYLTPLRSVVETPRERSLSLSEIAEIWRATEGLGFPFGPAIRLLILTAMRRQDVAEMPRWAIGSTDEGYPAWSLRDHRYGERGVFLAPLSPAAELIIKEAAAEPPTKRELVFSTNGKTPISGWSHAKRRLDETIRNAREQVYGAAAEPIEPWRLNDFRHSFFDLAVAHRGEDPMVIGQCLNRTRDLGLAGSRDRTMEDDTLDRRRIIMLSWAALVLAEIAKSRPDLG